MSHRETKKLKVTPIYDGAELMEYRVEGCFLLRAPLRQGESVFDFFKLPPLPQVEGCMLRDVSLHLHADHIAVEYTARFVPEQPCDGPDAGDMPQGCEPESALKEGDVVQLLSGGPAMTVSIAGNGSDPRILCRWFDKDDKPQSECFLPGMLTTEHQLMRGRC